ncbi:DNA repair protein RadA, partial [Francisella tularensis subsp. holarctica]|nr:DNA repair protein RadA [Francisella tularensis subsp. holarctica]
HSCNQWNTFVEALTADPKKVVKSRAGLAGSISKATSLSAIKGKEHSRVSTHSGEVDRGVGGGIVKGSVIVVGGDPG